MVTASASRRPASTSGTGVAVGGSSAVGVIAENANVSAAPRVRECRDEGPNLADDLRFVRHEQEVVGVRQQDDAAPWHATPERVGLPRGGSLIEPGERFERRSVLRGVPGPWTQGVRTRVDGQRGHFDGREALRTGEDRLSDLRLPVRSADPLTRIDIPDLPQLCFRQGVAKRAQRPRSIGGEHGRVERQHVQDGYDILAEAFDLKA